MYKYLFGPVPSRRLGISLGVDLVPRKVCSLDCVYCEVGKTTRHTLERKEYFPLEKIRSELVSFFSENPDPDYITFSGSGEPTLNTCIGDVITMIREVRPSVPIAVLTNGTLLSDRKVRAALLEADVVLPSLDAATKVVFEKIDRPAPGLDIDACIDGLVEFRREYGGKIWLEVFILPGYNDSKEELMALKKAIERIHPDLIQLNSLDRPGTVAGLVSATREDLQKIVDLWGMDNVEIISSARKRKELDSFSRDIEKSILEIVSRRPCTLDDFVRLSGLHVNEVNKYLDVLEADGRIETRQGDRGVFYRLIPR